MDSFIVKNQLVLQISTKPDRSSFRREFGFSIPVYHTGPKVKEKTEMVLTLAIVWWQCLLLPSGQVICLLGGKTVKM
jgi:hypothetical protein